MKEERRRYFRIDDTLGISYRLLGAEEAKAFVRESAHQGGNFDFISNFDNRIQTLLGACKVQSPIAAELLDLINKKLNFVIEHMDVDTQIARHITFQSRSVNISACGMAFPNEHALETGNVLQLDILLSPSNLHIVTMATVVACHEMDHDSCSPMLPHYVRIDFTQINHNDQEVLIQHVVKRQSAYLKQRRRSSGQ
ncbi:PilZ domain-containing protein [bacterium AH-315-K03]|nr:PilZ domain-containing protein [bacterium AH-315-K03]